MGANGQGKKKREVATFACGCFWSKEYFFSRIDGVVTTRVGYTGGHHPHPTYKEVCSKTTGHAEAVALTYYPAKVSFETLARHFFELHDPTIGRTDKGGQYRSAIFYHNESQKDIAMQLIQRLKAGGYEVRTQLEPANDFWPAEARHQKYCDTRGIVPKSYTQKRF